MTQDKELLLKDLCARLPYGVKGIVEDGIKVTTPSEWPVEKSIEFSMRYMIIKNGWRPYLFPLSSMTEEQKQYISDRWGINEDFDFEIDPNWGEYFVDLCDAVDYINWLNENHFDFRGLIEKGIALDATGLNIYQL